MKNKRGELNLTIIVVLIMVIFVALALVQAIFNQQSILTTKVSVTDEAFNLTSLGCLTGGELEVNETKMRIFLSISSNKSLKDLVSSSDVLFQTQAGDYFPSASLKLPPSKGTKPN